MEAQGYNINQKNIYQNNKSVILLEMNGKKSSTKRTCALNIRYFFMVDQVEKGNVQIQYCPTDEMMADYMMKPLSGKKFQKFRSGIMRFHPRRKLHGNARSVLDRNSCTQD
jgi:hypothetical protein